MNDLTIPTDEARIYLLAQYEKRNQIHPRLFEHTVASIMQGLGYKTRVTAYQGDNGIDIYLDGPNDTLVGIQVKRWNRSISIEQIHSLGGALIVNGCTEGIFVATSSFQRGAIANAKRFTDITGIPIKLVDAKKLYDALKITSSPTPLEARDPSTPWNICERPKLWS